MTHLRCWSPACWKTASRPPSPPSRNGSIAGCSRNCSLHAIIIGYDGSLKKHLPNHETVFNIHNSQPASPRPRRLRLPSYPQIENASDKVQRLSPKLVSEAFPMLTSGYPTRTANVQNCSVALFVI